MKDFAKATGKFLKEVIKILIFGEQPPNNNNHPGKASD